MEKSREVDTNLGGVAKILMKIKKRDEEEKKKVKESMVGNEIEKVVDVAAGVVMKYGENNERLVLMIQRSKDDHWPLHWEFPRGKCDKPIGEDTEHCIIREVKEETGLDVEPMTLLGIFEYLADKGRRKSVCHNYLCKVLNPDQKVKLSKEHSDFRWVSEAGEVQLLVLPDQLKVLQRVLNPERKLMNIPTNTFSQNDSVEEYLNFIQLDEALDKNNRIVPSWRKVLTKYQNHVTKVCKQVINRKCGRIDIRFTELQKLRRQLCKSQIYKICAKSIAKPICPQYRNTKDTELCNRHINGQAASYKADKREFSQKTSQLKKRIAAIEAKKKR